jgi:hypothetical protein
VRTLLAGLTVGKRVRGLAVLLACAGTTAALAGTVAAASAPAVRHLPSARTLQRRRVASRPRTFASCASLIRYGRHYLALTRGVPETPVQPIAGPAVPPGAGVLSAPPAASGAAPTTAGGTGGYSTTNNQEPGVDEPDTVKTDGSTIFAVSQNKLYAVAVASGGPQLAGSLDLGVSGYGSQLLLRGSHLIVISSGGGIGPVPVSVPIAGRGGGVARAAAVAAAGQSSSAGVPTRRGGGALVYPSPYYYGGQTTLTEVDVSDPAAMKIVRTITIDGSFVDARENGATARIVVSSAPPALAYPALRGRASGYVPSWHFHSLLSGRRSGRPVAGCQRVAHPAEFSGLGMATIFTIDLDRGLWTAGTDALMADAQVVYGSQDSLYLATEKWIDPTTPGAQLPAQQTTQIDRFDVSAPDSTTFVASGEVPGYLLNQYSLSESGGYLRVATTSRPDWWGGTVPQVPSQSYLTVLATDGSRLVPVGQLSGLGTGQKIYSVRFVGDTAYVVTFREVDPLYTIDLSDPTAPRVAGQLELEGYSSYLDPLGNGLLLGVGQDVGTTNEPSGSQLELFDVSDPSAPRLLQKLTLGQGSSSDVQYDPHAFLFWPPADLAVLPLQIYPVYTGPPVPSPVPGLPGGSTGTGAGTQDPSQGFIGAIGFHIDGSGIREVGRISHPQTLGYAPQITRSIVIGNQLYTVSDAGILASSLDTLSPGTFVAFPATPAPFGVSVPPAAP